MKKLFVFLLSITVVVLCLSCEKDDPSVLSGDQSAMGEVGVTVESSSVEIAGVSDASATVITLKSGVSSFSGSATVKNEFLKNLLANIPGITITGDKVSATNMEYKITKEGFECKTGPGAGILVKYGSSVGDTYKIGTTGQVRTVVAKTGVDDYPYGFYLIKVIKVEETPSYLKSSAGVTKITYIANHKFGLVGVLATFDDETTAEFPIYTSVEN
ncbi:MAG: hypothetical protein M0Q51_12775 [Bacteroidales bacterium]|nr:hypothetical protein [Bacteroidales bacterium]